MLSREGSCTPCARALSLPHADRADPTLSALAGAPFLASWAVAYVGLVPPDAPHRAHAARIIAVKVIQRHPEMAATGGAA